MPRSGPFVFLLLLGAAACATSEAEVTGPEGCVVVDNTAGAGSQSRVFLVSESSGWRLGMGEVGMGDTLEFCTPRIRGAEHVHILIEDPAFGEANPSLIRTPQGHIRSRTFTLHLDDVWTWDVDLNQLTRAVRF